MKNFNLIGLKVVAIVFALVLNGCEPKREPIGIGSIEVLEKRELHLVKYKYHDMIFIHKKDNPEKKLRMIVK